MSELPATSTRHVLMSGTSKCIALPPDWLRAFGLEVGDVVDVLYDSLLLVKPRNLRLDLDFLVKEFRILAENNQNIEAWSSN